MFGTACLVVTSHVRYIFSYTCVNSVLFSFNQKQIMNEYMHNIFLDLNCNKEKLARECSMLFLEPKAFGFTQVVPHICNPDWEIPQKSYFCQLYPLRIAPQNPSIVLLRSTQICSNEVLLCIYVIIRSLQLQAWLWPQEPKIEGKNKSANAIFICPLKLWAQSCTHTGRCVRSMSIILRSPFTTNEKVCHLPNALHVPNSEVHEALKLHGHRVQSFSC